MLSGRYFLPIFVTQFTGALNDNFFKNALVMLLTYRLGSDTGIRADILVTLCSAIFILPFFLFSALAGQWADRADKAMIARIVKQAEIILMLLAAIGFFTQNVNILFAVLFGMGTHSAFFGPVKYSILPQHVPQQLRAANGWVEAGTFIAILLGTILGGALILLPQGEVFVSVALLLLAVAGYGAARHIPPATGQDPDLRLNWNIFSETAHILRLVWADRVQRRLLLLISWFWLVGSVYLSQLPFFVRDVLQASGSVATVALTVFSLGIGLGSLVVTRLQRNPALVLLASAAVMGFAGFDLKFAAPNLLRVMLDLFIVSFAAGCFVVPLYTRLQQVAPVAFVSRSIAALNIMNALFMAVGAVICAVLLKGGLTSATILMILSLAQIPVLFFIWRIRKEIT